MIRLNAESNTFDILNISMEQIKRIPEATRFVAAEIIATEYLKENKDKIIASINAQAIKSLVEERIAEDIKKIKIEELTSPKK